MNISRTTPIVPTPVDRTGERAPAPVRQDATAGATPMVLWDVLTPEEREFFAQQTALGPLTYRHGGTPSSDAPAPTGRRIDVRG